MTKKVLKEQQQETRELVKQIFTLALAKAALAELQKIAEEWGVEYV